MKGPDATSHATPLAIVITWDEDDDHSGNHVPLMVIDPSLKGKQKQVTTRLDHYGLSASIAPMGRRLTAPALADKSARCSRQPSASHEIRPPPAFWCLCADSRAAFSRGYGQPGGPRCHSFSITSVKTYTKTGI